MEPMSQILVEMERAFNQFVTAAKKPKRGHVIREGAGKSRISASRLSSSELIRDEIKRKTTTTNKKTADKQDIGQLGKFKDRADARVVHDP